MVRYSRPGKKIIKNNKNNNKIVDKEGSVCEIEFKNQRVNK